MSTSDIPKLIKWSKWVDPLGKNEGNEYIAEEEVKDFDNTYEPYADDEDDDEMNEGPTPVIVTPMGVLPIKNFNDPSKVFNFWMGETTFNIGKKRAAIINKTPGVEILDVFTRYKFRICIGNNFKFQDVRQAIEKNLNAVPPPKAPVEDGANMILTDDLKDQIKQLIQVQLVKFPYWAIYVLPNGQMDMSAYHEQGEAFNEKLEVYTMARKLAGGAIVKYDQQIV